MPAHSLYRYYHDSRAKIRNQVLTYFPRTLVTMKSGRGFHESCNEVYVKAFREEMSTAKLRNGAHNIRRRKSMSCFRLSTVSSRNPLGTMGCWLKFIVVIRSLRWMLLLSWKIRRMFLFPAPFWGAMRRRRCVEWTMPHQAHQRIVLFSLRPILVCDTQYERAKQCCNVCYDFWCSHR